MWTTPLRQGKSIISKHNLNGIDQILWTIIDDDLDHEFLGGTEKRRPSLEYLSALKMYQNGGQ